MILPVYKGLGTHLASGLGSGVSVISRQLSVAGEAGGGDGGQDGVVLPWDASPWDSVGQVSDGIPASVASVVLSSVAEPVSSVAKASVVSPAVSSSSAAAVPAAETAVPATETAIPATESPVGTSSVAAAISTVVTASVVTPIAPVAVEGGELVGWLSLEVSEVSSGSHSEEG